MKQKRSPKQKIEEIYRQLKGDAEFSMHLGGLSADNITPQSTKLIQVSFAPENPQTPYAASALRALEQDGYIVIDGFLNSVWGETGPDLTAYIYVNRDRLYPPSRWQQFKKLIGL